MFFITPNTVKSLPFKLSCFRISNLVGASTFPDFVPNPGGCLLTVPLRSHGFNENYFFGDDKRTA
jgi:hypothetical protein